jgi:hypothetical protein
VTGSFKARHLGLLTLALVFCVALTGCGDGGINKANYDKIKENESTAADVEKIMGSKGTDLNDEAMKKAGITATGEGIKVVRWGDDNKFIVVVYMKDKVFTKHQKGL